MNHLDIIVLISAFAALLQIGGYFSYSRHVIGGNINPNTTTWIIWAFGSMFNCFSYIAASGDWVKELLPIACAVSCIVTFFICYMKDKFMEPKAEYMILLVFDLLVTLIWWETESAVYANLLYQISTIASFIPIFIEIKRDSKVERSEPWFIWSAAYLLLTLVVMVRLNSWIDIVYPLNCLVLHLAIGIIVRKSEMASKQSVPRKQMNIALQ